SSIAIRSANHGGAQVSVAANSMNLGAANGISFYNNNAFSGSSALDVISSTVGIGTNAATPSAQLHIISTSASRVGLRVDSAGSPTAPVLRLTNNGTFGYVFWADYWQVQKEATADPTSSQLSAGDHFAIYRKNDKLVIAYNNGGTITYLTIPLDGSTTTFTQSTTAP